MQVTHFLLLYVFWGVMILNKQIFCFAILVYPSCVSHEEPCLRYRYIDKTLLCIAQACSIVHYAKHRLSMICFQTRHQMLLWVINIWNAYVNIAISSFVSFGVYVKFIQQVFCPKEDHLHISMMLVFGIGFFFAYNISFALATGMNKAHCAC